VCSAEIAPAGRPARGSFPWPPLLVRDPFQSPAIFIGFVWPNGPRRWDSRCSIGRSDAMPALIAVVALAAILGFATHRASICTVRAVAELMSSRRAFMLASVGKSILWASAVTIPFFLLSMSTPPQSGAWTLSITAVLGGFTFGVGAAMNGACVY